MSGVDPTLPRPPPNEVEDFHVRGERAWNEYRRTGVASSVDEVFERIAALIAERRAQLSTDRCHKQSCPACRAGHARKLEVRNPRLL
jgi:hypothetical protein